MVLSTTKTGPESAVPIVFCTMYASGKCLPLTFFSGLLYRPRNGLRSSTPKERMTGSRRIDTASSLEAVCGRQSLKYPARHFTVKRWYSGLADPIVNPSASLPYFYFQQMSDCSNICDMSSNKWREITNL